MSATSASPGELLIVWFARIFVACYVLRVFVDLTVADAARRARWARLAWTAGCAFFLLHLAAAFHFLHHWSHASAFEQTARRTAEVIGIYWGGGIYVNYAFTLLWVFDVAWWWRRAARDKRTPGAYYWAMQAVFAFMMVNATVVFGPPFWKWIVAGAVPVLVAAHVLSRLSLIPVRRTTRPAPEVSTRSL